MKISRLCMANLVTVLSNRDILAHFLSCLFEVDIDQDLLKINIAPNHDLEHGRPDIVAVTTSRVIGVSIGTWHSAEHITTEAAELASYLSITYHMARNYVVIISPAIPAAWPQDYTVHYISPYPGCSGDINSPGNHVYIIKSGGDIARSIDLRHLSVMLSGRFPTPLIPNSPVQDFPAPLIEHIWAADINIPWDFGMRLLAKSTYREALHSTVDPDDAVQTALGVEAIKRANAILTYASTYGLGLSDYELARALGLTVEQARAVMAGEELDIGDYIKEEE